jgi:lysophospholipase L1-like esterase
MRRLRRALAAAGLPALGIAVSMALVACSRTGSGGDATAPAGGVLLALGDSVAAGNGASDAATTGFVALVAADEGLRAEDLARAGATTQDVLDVQLDPAVDALRAGGVRAVVISAGGNDLAALIPNAACVQDPLPAACPLDETLAALAGRLDRILAALREADARVPIVLLAYPNFFSHTGHPFEAPAARVLPRLAATLRSLAARRDNVRIADAAPAFEGHGDALTHVLDTRSDPHPNDAGHRAIADTVEAALR